MIQDICYRAGALTPYEEERCRLDLFIPEGVANFPTLVWFHGGGLAFGDKTTPIYQAIARRFAAVGIAMALANYRFSPRVTYPAYVEDAAAATAWVVAHIADYGGSSRNVFITGDSAGGYLAALIGTDPHYLAQHDVPLTDIAGVMPISGQMVTHFTVRAERGIPNPGLTPFLDTAAPCYHIAPDLPPILAFCGDHDMATRAEENRYFIALLHAAGHPDAAYCECLDRDHGTIVGEMEKDGDPGWEAMRRFVQRHMRDQHRSPVHRATSRSCNTPSVTE